MTVPDIELTEETIFTWGAPPLKFGAGASDEIGFEMSGYGVRRVLIVTDPGVSALGIPQRIADTLHVSTLEQLELAAERGELAAVPRLGPRRIRMLRATVNAMLSRIRRPDRRPDLEPPVSMLLDVDREYRAQSDVLPKLAPRQQQQQVHHQCTLPLHLPQSSNRLVS